MKIARRMGLMSLISCLLILMACQASNEAVKPTATSGIVEFEATATPTPMPTATVIPPTPAETLETTPPDLIPLPESETVLAGLMGSPTTLNPITGNHPAARQLTPLLYESLLQVDPNTATLQPGLAQAWEFSRNGRQVTFTLPDNLVWSNGEQMTAGAIVESLQATQHLALLSFSTISAPNDQTVQMTFDTINCSALTTLGLLPLIPSADIESDQPLGSGPFAIAEWSENRRTLILGQNPNYHGDAPPSVPGFTIRFLNQDTLEVILSEGQFDVVGPFPPLTLNRVPDYLTDITYPTAQMIYLAISYDPKNKDPLPQTVREALLVGLDREVLLNEAAGGDGQRLAGPLLPTHWAANEMITEPDFNVEMAKTLLQRSGLRDTNNDGWLEQDGERLELSIRLNGQNQLHQNLGWLISSYYRDLGLFVRAEGAPRDSVIDDLFTHDFRLAIFHWPILPDPDQQIYWHSREDTPGLGLNFTSYDNPDLDVSLFEANSIPDCDPQTRAEIYGEIQETLSRDRPVDFLMAPNQHLLVGPRLQGVQPGPFRPFTWNVNDWQLQR